MPSPIRAARAAVPPLSWEAVVSHQLKTPLCAMQARLEQAAAVDPSRMLHEVQRMIRLIDQLHLAGMCRTGRVKVALTPLMPSVAAVCSRLAPLALDRGQRFELRCLGPEPEVMIDPTLAQEAVCNLVENAIKYSPADSTIVIAVTGGGMVHVLDEGPGMTVEDRTRMLEPFRRGSAAADLPGSGLGLSLAGSIMRMHRGALSQVNRTRGGSAFTLRFRRRGETALTESVRHRSRKQTGGGKVRARTVRH